MGWHEVIASQHSQHPMNQRFAIVAKFTDMFLLPEWLRVLRLKGQFP